MVLLVGRQGEGLRLRREEQEFLLSLARKLDPQARLFVYGSRVHPEARGGDIDLVLESSRVSSAELWQIRRPFCRAFGEQKIDILIHDPKKDESAFLRSIARDLVEIR